MIEGTFDIGDAFIPEGPELVIIPKYRTQCRVCQWSKEAVEFYNWISTLALQGYPAHRMHTLAIEHAKNFPGVVVPTRKSIWTHYKKHVNVLESVKIEVAKKDKGVVRALNPLLTQKAIEEIRQGNFDEYKELCALYVKFREVHDNIYELANALTVTRMAGHDDWSQTKIQTYVSMVNTQKSILSEIGKMRQSDKLVVMVAKHIIEVFAKSMVDRLSDEFASLGHIMRRQGVDETVLQAFEAITHGRLARLIVDEADNAMTITKREFKLPIN